jgi:hypothetical protein
LNTPSDFGNGRVVVTEWGEDATTMWETITLCIRVCRLIRKWCFVFPQRMARQEFTILHA